VAKRAVVGLENGKRRTPIYRLRSDMSFGFRIHQRHSREIGK